jgi:hypothetical protein
VFPIIDVANPGLFTLKMIGAIIGLQLAPAIYYWRVRRPGAK